jgi:hypothetical protein
MMRPNYSKYQRSQEDRTVILDAAQALMSLAPSIWFEEQFGSRRVPSRVPSESPLQSGIPHNWHPPAKEEEGTYQEVKKTILKQALPPPEPRWIPTAAVSSCDSSLDDRSVTSESTAHTPSHVASSPKLLSRTHPSTPPMYYEGSVSLALPEDDLSLSPLHCFMRQYCVVAFTASAADVATPRYGKSHGRSIRIGQVGIQCVFCQHRPYATRPERAVCFPSTLKNIYHSIETWQRRHSVVCHDIPAWAKEQMTRYMGKSRSSAGGRRQYWEESARRLNMVDTPTGIRFVGPPGTLATEHEQDGQETLVSTDTPAMEEMHEEGASTPGQPLVLEEDRDLVTDFLFTLLQQMETCSFSEQDRVGGRSKVKDCALGYPGLQCKHCGGKAGFGRYYPISIHALTSANSDRNIFNHVDKCRRCPDAVRYQLHSLLEQQHACKNRRGNRKLFFERIWERMHGGPPQVEEEEVGEKEEYVNHLQWKQQPKFWQQQAAMYLPPPLWNQAPPHMPPPELLHKMQMRQQEVESANRWYVG